MYKQMQDEIIAVLEKHGYHNRMFIFKGQKVLEDKILEVKNNPAPYDAKTYGDTKTYAEFLERGNDLKYVFMKISPARMKWKISFPDLIKEYDAGKFIFEDHCPYLGVRLDPGFGRNSVTELPEFKPSFEHIITRKQINDKGLDIAFNDISNLEIVSSAANTYLNKGVPEHRFQLFASELMRNRA
tara:strand:- start:40 stop:594 length:555 start_codon:yes stop_codon:yes gene_type:complete